MIFLIESSIKIKNEKFLLSFIHSYDLFAQNAKRPQQPMETSPFTFAVWFLKVFSFCAPHNKENHTGLGTSWEWINDTIFIFVWSSPLKRTLPVWENKTHTLQERACEGTGVQKFVHSWEPQSRETRQKIWGGAGRPWVPERVLKGSFRAFGIPKVGGPVRMILSQNAYLEIGGRGIWAVQESICYYGGPGCLSCWEAWRTGYLLA